MESNLILILMAIFQIEKKFMFKIFFKDSLNRITVVLAIILSINKNIIEI